MAELSDRDKRMLKRQQRALEEEKHNLLREMKRQRKQLIQLWREGERMREVTEYPEVRDGRDARVSKSPRRQPEEPEGFRKSHDTTPVDKDRQDSHDSLQGASGTSQLFLYDAENVLTSEDRQESTNHKSNEDRIQSESGSLREQIQDSDLQRRIGELRKRVSDSLDRKHFVQNPYPRLEDSQSVRPKSHSVNKENPNPHEESKLSGGHLNLPPSKSKEIHTVQEPYLAMTDERLRLDRQTYLQREGITSEVESEYYSPGYESSFHRIPLTNRYKRDQKEATDTKQSIGNEREENDGVFISGDMDNEVKELLDRLDRLEFQDRLIEEENRKRVKEEAYINERLKMIRLRNAKIDEQRYQAQRLLEMRDREEKLEHSLQRKIKEQVRQDARLSLLLQEEKRLLEDTSVKEKMYSLPPTKEILDPEQERHQYRTDQRLQGIGLVPKAEDVINSISLEELQFQETEEQRFNAARDLKKKETLPIKSENADSDNLLAMKDDNKDSNQALKLKEEELNSRESYLKNLERELQQKEDGIREKLNLKPTSEHAEETQIIKGASSSETVSKQSEVTHFLRPYINTFSGSDPLPKNESTFEEWKLEIECLSKSKVYNEHPDIVNQAIRNSLKGQARKVLVTLGPEATNKAIKEKLESVFGNVASGESVLQEFYTAKQLPNESVALWGIRIEEIIQKAIEKGHISPQQKNEMLRTKFWRALYSTELKNATRVHFESVQNFELLRRKVRAEEYEMATNKSATEKESKSETKIKTVPVPENTEKTSSTKTVEVQHQPVLQDPNTKLLKDIVKRMEILENRIETMNKPRQTYRWGQNQWRNTKQSEQTNVKTAAKTPAEKKEQLNK